LVDENALAEALRSGQIAGAGLDVLSVEPPKYDNPLFQLENCFITPHVAWATQTARQTLLEMSVANLQAFLQGHPQNVVN
jgi:glycerate dehydrogenase